MTTLPRALLDALSAARSRWIAAYRDELTTFLSEHRPSAGEVLLQLPGAEGREAFRLLRVDLAAGGKVAEVNLPALPKSPTVEVKTRRGSLVSIEPIVWNGVEFAVDGIDSSDASLEAWCRAWLDIDDENPPAEDGFSGAIHHMSAPTRIDGATSFEIDFGTAPLAAVEDLFDVLEATGARRVRLSSRWLDDPREHGPNAARDD